MKSSLLRFVPVLAATFLFLTSAVSAETFSLKLRRVGDQSDALSGSENLDFLCQMTRAGAFPLSPGFLGLAQDEQNPFDSVIHKEPREYRSKTPYRGVLHFGSQRFGFVLDSKDKDSKQFGRLLFDTNGNGDLTDDQEIPAVSPEKNQDSEGFPGDWTEFPRVDITLTVGGQKVPYAFTFRILIFRIFSGTMVDGAKKVERDERLPAFAEVHPAAYRHGEVTLNGKRHRITLLDYNGNGRFDDRWTVEESDQYYYLYPKTGDLLLVDYDAGNRELGYYPTQQRNSHSVSDLLWVDGRFYNVSIAPSGETIELKPTEVPLGQLKTPHKGCEVLVYGDRGFLKFNTGDAAKPISLPAGKWRLLEYTMEVTDSAASQKESEDEEGRSKRTYAYAMATRDCPEVEIPTGKTVNFPFGPPFRPSVDISPARRREGSSSPEVQLNMSLLGTAGEMCRGLMVKGERPEAPSFAIAAGEGKVLAQGNFKYG